MGPFASYPAIGGLTAWRIPILCSVLAVPGMMAGAWLLAALVLVAGGVARSLERALVLDLSPQGLSRGLALGRVRLNPSVVAWASVTEIATAWRGPRDFTMLVTTVQGRDGRVRFSTAMGLRAYRALLAEAVRRAPQARRTGLTDEVLVEARRAGVPPGVPR